MNENNIFKDGSALLVVLTLVVTGMLCIMSVMLHLHNSLMDAVNTLQVCQADGMSECHIERDGFNYNVYGESKLGE